MMSRSSRVGTAAARGAAAAILMIGAFFGCGGDQHGSTASTSSSGGAGASSSAASGAGGATSSSSTGAGGNGGGASAACMASSLPPPKLDCASPAVHCVDDTPGSNQEFTTIQAAADIAAPGDVIVVFDGNYTGFQVDHAGTANAPIVFFANGKQVMIDKPAPTGDGIRLQNVSHVRVEGFRIHDVPERCIAARGATPAAPMADLWVLRNTCDRAGVEGFYLSEVSGSHVELNAISKSGFLGSTRSHGIYLANAGSDGTVLCGNVIQGATPAESNGIHFNGDLSVGGDGIISGLVVEANVIFDNAQNGLNLDGVQDSVFRNNVVFGNVRNALRAYAIDAAEGPKGLVIVNNTFLTTAAGGWPVKLTEDLGGHVVFNNVLLTDNPNTGSIALANSPGFQSANNVVVDRFTPDDENSTLSLAMWQALGYDAGSIVSTKAALFMNPAGNDYSLLPGAPAVDKGIGKFQGKSAPDHDILGASRPSGAAFDIGAYERP